MELIHLLNLTVRIRIYLFIERTNPYIQNMVHRKMILFIANKILMLSHKSVMSFRCIIIGHKVYKVFRNISLLYSIIKRYCLELSLFYLDDENSLNCIILLIRGWLLIKQLLQTQIISKCNRIE